MQNFDYRRAGALDELNSLPGGSKFLGGGTTLIDLMKLDVELPSTVIDLRDLPLREVTTGKAGLRVGALVTNSDLARHPVVMKEYPVLSQAILAGASAQLRNKATTAGNLLQRTRCVYFRNTHEACNKRTPKTGCAAIGGHNRNLAILGTSDQCIANNPSDQNVALMALDTVVQTRAPNGHTREIKIQDFYTLPGTAPHVENTLLPGELITGIVIPPAARGARSLYLKLRDRASYEFALASLAVEIVVEEGKFKSVRLAMGGIGARPWRLDAAEKILTGGPATVAQFEKAAAETLRAARPQSQNAFKVELAKRCLVQGLNMAVAMKG